MKKLKLIIGVILYSIIKILTVPLVLSYFRIKVHKPLIRFYPAMTVVGTLVMILVVYFKGNIGN
ncbi:hypothetical protein MWH28_12720 [Natroniella sulfidigena]|uniref:hypothetical protein n=1 Tax=Natroniella sulfidigena TaxID=723921 RepID=UPI00200A19A3|nr:hypothetical protein [Natroniella sulfidigena]MCK8818221.1 hypothetical protein [Natroniella sulfidigena]